MPFLKIVIVYWDSKQKLKNKTIIINLIPIIRVLKLLIPVRNIENKNIMYNSYTNLLESIMKY